MACLFCSKPIPMSRLTNANPAKYCSKVCGRKYYYSQTKNVSENIRMKKAYGISLEDYCKLAVIQNHVCAICHKGSVGRGKLHVDHDHDTGRVRGLLCFNCNDGLGRFSDNPELLANAISYLT